jgi:hypothetical protein
LSWWNVRYLVSLAGPLADPRLAALPVAGLPAGSPVRLYRNPRALPRAWWVPAARRVPDQRAALETVAAPGFDPRREVVLEAPGEGVAAPPPGPAWAGPRVTVAAHRPDTVILEVDAPAPGHVVLADAAYPGWTAVVDGRAAPVLRANALMRAVFVTAGPHRIVLRFRPRSVAVGAAVTLAAAVGLGTLLLADTLRHRP